MIIPDGGFETRVGYCRRGPLPLFSSALLVHFLGATTDLLLKLGCGLRHDC